MNIGRLLNTKKAVKNSVKRKIFLSQVHSCCDNRVKRNADSEGRQGRSL